MKRICKVTVPVVVTVEYDDKDVSPGHMYTDVLDAIESYKEDIEYLWPQLKSSIDSCVCSDTLLMSVRLRYELISLPVFKTL